MFKTISKTIPKDNEFSDRVFDLEVRKRLLDGTFYDFMQHEFNEERHPTGEHIPLRNRAPCTPYNLPQIIVKDSVSFLFGEGRFPSIDSADTASRETLETVIRNCGLQQIMIDAARKGSIGSVAVLMRVLSNDDGENKIHFEALETQFLTPTYKLNSPDALEKVTLRYKVKGSDLADAGYTIKPELYQSDFWMQQIYDGESETRFLPMLVSECKDKYGNLKPMIEDADRTLKHNLGFVPIVWIKNLPGGKGFDGACTFENAIKIGIEIDYQLSQVGRGLKYSGDPMLVISGMPDSGPMKRDASSALRLGEGGAADLLELNGSAAQTVIDYCRALREMALEACGGNRVSIDHQNLPQSGRAMELLYLPLIMLADTLRGSYGEGGLKSILRMVLRAQGKLGNLMAGDALLPKVDARSAFSLRWPDFFEPTSTDKAQQASALVALMAAGALSRDTAVKSIASVYDIEDVTAEIASIEADAERRDVETTALAALTAKKNVIPEDVSSQLPK